MRSVIRQSIVLPAAAESLYGMYLDPAAESALWLLEIEVERIATGTDAGRQA